MEIAGAVSRALAGRLGPDQFDLWFDRGRSLAYDGAVLSVLADSRFKLDRLRKHYLQDLEAAARDVLGEAVEIAFRVGETSRDARCEGEANAADEGEKPAPPHASAEPPRQGSISVRRKFASLRSFVVGDANRVAYTSCELVAHSPGELSPLFLHGPSGCGKTHLLEGIWSEVRRHNTHGRVVYLTAEQFTSYFLESLHGKGLPSFRRKYRDVDVLLIDDVQFFAGKKATLTELQHTIDNVQRQGKQLVLTADRPPSQLGELGPTLVARLSAGVVCPLQPADSPMRLAIARQVATKLQLEVPKSVLQYIADHLPGDARQVAGALQRLRATSLAHQEPITLTMAQRALSDMVRASQRPVQLADIERVVCDVLGLQPTSLRSQRRAKMVSHPRMLAMWLARKHTRVGLVEIGTYFGRRSHATVVSAHKNVESWLASDSPLNIDGRSWHVDDALREIENRLRTG